MWNDLKGGVALPKLCLRSRVTVLISSSYKHGCCNVALMFAFCKVQCFITAIQSKIPEVTFIRGLSETYVYHGQHGIICAIKNQKVGLIHREGRL